MDTDSSGAHINIAPIHLDSISFAVKRKIGREVLNSILCSRREWQDDMDQTMVVELTAKITAAKVECDPVVLSETVGEAVTVLDRPVRDGILLWLSGLWILPDRLGYWLMDKARVTRVEPWRRVTQQQITYYACPHVALPESNTVHFAWMGEKSGQLREGTAQAAGSAAAGYDANRYPIRPLEEKRKDYS